MTVAADGPMAFYRGRLVRMSYLDRLDTMAADAPPFTDEQKVKLRAILGISARQRYGDARRVKRRGAEPGV